MLGTGNNTLRTSHPHQFHPAWQTAADVSSQHLRRESLKVSRYVGYDHPMLLPLQRSSMFFPGGRFVVCPKRRKRPLSKTWVSRDWPFPPASLGLGCRTFTRFPPGLMRFSPTSFLRLTCWQSPGYTQEKEKGGRGARNNNEENKDKSETSPVTALNQQI